MRTDVSREDFVNRALTVATYTRRRVFQHLSAEDLDAVLTPARAGLATMWCEGFSVDDAARMLLLSEEFSPHLSEEYACAEMAKLKAKYAANKKEP